MADPATIAVLSAAAISAAGATYQGVEASRQARSQSNAAEERAQMVREIGAHNAEAARQQAAAEERRYRTETRRRMASAENQLAAAGAGLTGTPLAVLGDAMTAREEDAQLIRFGGSIQERNIRREAAVGAGDLDYQSRFYRQRAGATLLGGFAQGFGTMARGFGNAYTLSQS